MNLFQIKSSFKLIERQIEINVESMKPVVTVKTSLMKELKKYH